MAELDGDAFFANVMPETYRRSNLGELAPGDRVNLERSVRPTDRLSGHIVRGVVEGVATIESFTPEADAIIARFRTPPELLRYMVVKGPVCIDGASLTIIDKTADSFAVSLVQYTQAHTNLIDKHARRVRQHRDRHHRPLRRERARGARVRSNSGRASLLASRLALTRGGSAGASPSRLPLGRSVKPILRHH